MEKQTALLKLLIIEDDEDDYIIIRELLKEIETSEFEITWVSDYFNALELLGKRDYDICLLDYRLGANDGLGILRLMSARSIDIPVIFLTGQGEYRVDVQAMEAGAADYLVKGDFTSSLLERSIRYTLDRFKTARKLREAHDRLEEEVRRRTAELINANNELKKASEKIKFFAYSLSHDLKSPATALFGLTWRFRNMYENLFDTKGKDYCEAIMNSARQILSLVEKINVYISEKEMPLTIEDINFKELLNEIRGEFFDRIKENGIYWQEPEESFFMKADRISIIRVLRNIVENAFKYGGDNLSYIRVGFESTPEFHIISVSDDGPGLKDINENIFMPFQRIGVTKNKDGSGMGLAIVKEIAEKHGGDAWSGKNSSRGASFYFSISRDL